MLISRRSTPSSATSLATQTSTLPSPPPSRRSACSAWKLSWLGLEVLPGEWVRSKVVETASVRGKSLCRLAFLEACPPGLLDAAIGHGTRDESRSPQGECGGRLPGAPPY